MTATYDLTGIRRGNSFERTFRFKDADGDPIDLTGSIIVFSVTSGSTVIRKSTSNNGLLMPTPSNGEVTLRLTPSETRQFAVGKLRNRYEIERQIGANETTLVWGCIVVSQGINDDD